MSESAAQIADIQARAVASRMDAEIQKAIDSRIGEYWTLEWVKEHGKLVRRVGDNFETLLLDGEPILEIYDPVFRQTVENGAYIMRVDQNFRHLKPYTPKQPASES